MKRRTVFLIFVCLAIVAVADILDKDGKAARTGSPGEFDCTGCHTSFPVNSGPGSISISSPNLTNWQYVPGQVYQIDVTVAQSGVGLFGFGFEALRTSNNTNGGTLSITNSTQTSLKSASVSGSSRTNVVHKLNGGLSANTHTFSFNWTAPATNIGNIRFWTAGNAANNNNDSINDYIYKTSQLVTPLSVGLNENSQASDLQTYPNPAKEQFTVSGLKEAELVSYQMIDMQGKVVLSKQEVVLNNSLVINLAEELQDGIYIFSLMTKEKTVSTRILHYN